MSNLSQSRLRELLTYSPETGEFAWISRTSNRVKIGAPAGAVVDGYVAIGIDGVSYLAHRLAWLYVHGEFPKGHLDHANGDRQDNRIGNLRIASIQQNATNQTKPTAGNRSGYLGVSWHAKAAKWEASIVAHGKKHYLGLHPTPEVAHRVYLKAKADLHPFATLRA